MKNLLPILALLLSACCEPASVETFIPGEGPYVFQWTSPSDSLFREKVFLPLAPQVYLPYRAGVVPREPGEWKLTVTVPSAPEGLRGMGLVLTIANQDTPTSF